MADSALTLVSRLNMQLSGIVTALDIDIIGRETAKILAKIKQLSPEVRLDVRDWEMADSRIEMEQNAKAAVKRLEELRLNILKASEHGIFSAIDVIHLSAQIDAITEELR